MTRHDADPHHYRAGAAFRRRRILRLSRRLLRPPQPRSALARPHHHRSVPAVWAWRPPDDLKQALAGGGGTVAENPRLIAEALQVLAKSRQASSESPGSRDKLPRPRV